MLDKHKSEHRGCHEMKKTRQIIMGDYEIILINNEMLGLAVENNVLSRTRYYKETLAPPQWLALRYYDNAGARPSCLLAASYIAKVGNDRCHQYLTHFETRLTNCVAVSGHEKIHCVM